MGFNAPSLSGEREPWARLKRGQLGKGGEVRHCTGVSAWYNPKPSGAGEGGGLLRDLHVQGDVAFGADSPRVRSVCRLGHPGRPRQPRQSWSTWPVAASWTHPTAEVCRGSPRSHALGSGECPGVLSPAITGPGLQLSTRHLPWGDKSQPLF